MMHLLEEKFLNNLYITSDVAKKTFFEDIISNISKS